MREKNEKFDLNLKGGIGHGWIALSFFISAIWLFSFLDKKIDCAIGIQPACQALEKGYSK